MLTKLEQLQQQQQDQQQTFPQPYLRQCIARTLIKCCARRPQTTNLLRIWNAWRRQKQPERTAQGAEGGARDTKKRREKSVAVMQKRTPMSDCQSHQEKGGARCHYSCKFKFRTSIVNVREMETAASIFDSLATLWWATDFRNAMWSWRSNTEQCILYINYCIIYYFIIYTMNIIVLWYIYIMIIYL